LFVGKDFTLFGLFAKIGIFCELEEAIGLVLEFIEIKF
jgi:hypothetical protein